MESRLPTFANTQAIFHACAEFEIVVATGDDQTGKYNHQKPTPHATPPAYAAGVEEICQ
jgi:hypothetical protein